MPSERRTHDADATGELLELSADDILESDDIDALDAAAAGYDATAFVDDPTTRAVAPSHAPAPVLAAPPAPHRSAPPPPVATTSSVMSPSKPSSVPPSVAAAPKPAPVVTAPAIVVAPPAPAPAAPSPAPVAAAPAPAPAAVAASASADADDPEDGIVTASMKTTTAPPPPNTSPLPLEESVIIAEPPLPERTLELRDAALLQVASAAAALDLEGPGQTEVLHRSAMPSAIRTTLGGLQAAAPAQARSKPTSLAPVAVDVRGRAAVAMPRVPSNAHVPPAHLATGRPAPNAPMSGLVIGGLAVAALALIGVVGLGGYAATRALSDKTEAPVAVSAPSESEPSGAATTTQGQQGAASQPSEPSPLPPGAVPGPVGASDPGSAGSGSPVDVSALPSAPTPGSRAAATHGFSAGGAAPAEHTASASPAPVSRSVGGAAALPPPGAAPAPVTAAAAPRSTSGGGALALPPPAAAPAAPARPAVASSTGVIHVDPKLRAVTVDGSWHHATDGAVTVSCGPHRVKAGMNDEQSINVPCGGAVSL